MASLTTTSREVSCVWHCDFVFNSLCLLGTSLFTQTGFPLFKLLCLKNYIFKLTY